MDEGEVQAAVAENAEFKSSFWYKNGGAEFWRALGKDKTLILWKKEKERRGGWFFNLFC